MLRPALIFRKNCNNVDIVKLKIPQSATINPSDPNNTTHPDGTFTFGRGALPDGDLNSYIRNERWRKQAYKFEYGKIYSIAKYFGTVRGTPSGGIVPDNGAFGPVNQITLNPSRNSGVIVVDSSPASELIGMVYNNQARLNYNNIEASGSDPLVNVFGAEWLNLSIYLPQFLITTAGINDTSNNVTDYKTQVADMVRPNTQLVAATVLDTSLFLRSDYHPTDFIEVPRTDLVMMRDIGRKGFYIYDFTTPPLGTYKGDGNTKYFFKGASTANSIDFLFENGIL